MASTVKPKPKKPYAPPVLRIYGDVYKLTQSFKPTGATDNVNRRTRTGFG